jgi:hypothetical protein
MAKSAARHGKTGPTSTDARRRSRRRRPASAGEIARRAYDIYLSRGCQHGHDVEDWLRAERELIGGPNSADA